MRIRSLVPSLVLLTGMHAAEVSVPLVTAAPDGTEASARADLERLRHEALLTKPTSLFADPAAAQAIAHLRQQLITAQEADRDFPPLLQMAEQARSILLALGAREQTTIGQNERELLAIAALIDAGPAAADTQQWISNRSSALESEASTVGAYVGWKNADALIASAGTVTALVSPLLYDTWPAATTATAAPVSVVEARADLTAFVRALSAKIAADPYAEEKFLFKVLPELATSMPQVSADITVAGGWKGLLQVTGLGPLPAAASMDATVLGRLGDYDAMVALALDPQALVTRILAMAAIETGSTVEELTAEADTRLAPQGVTLAQLSGMLSGTIAVGMTWRAGPVPMVLGVLGVSDAEPLAQLLAMAAEQAGGQEEAVDGAIAAWTFVQLPVPVTVVLGKNVLAISQDAALAAMALAAPAAVPEVIAHEAVVVEVKKSLMTTGLQLGWNSLITLDEPLIYDQRLNVSWLHAVAPERLRDRDDTVPWPTTFAALAGDDAESLTEAINHVREACQPLPAANGLAFADASFALLISPEDSPYMASALVWREADGFKVYSDDSYQVRSLDAGGLAQLVADLPRRVGAEPATLAEIGFPVIPRLDAKCFPSLPTVVRHLPERYRASLSLTSEAIVVREEGIPVLTGFLGAFATVSPVGVLDLHRQRLWREKSARDEALAAQYETTVESFRAAARAIELARSEGMALPPKVSGLIGETYGLTLEDMAGLFAGEVPTEAAALDTIGIWRPVLPEDALTEWVWRLPLDEGMSLVVFPWGSVEFMEDANIK